MSSVPFRIIVGVKRVVDYAVRVRVSKDNSGVDLSSVKMSINPFCEIAVEEAVRIKERFAKAAGTGATAPNVEVVAVTIGPKPAVADALMKALSIGADRGIHIDTTGTPYALRPDHMPTLRTAKLLAHISKKESAQLIFLGKQSIDDDSAHVGGMIGGLLECGQGSNLAKCSVADDLKSVTVERETDLGLQTLRLSLPAVLTADLRLNTPRYPSIPNMMKSKKKPLAVIPLADIEKECGLSDVKDQLEVVRVDEPKARKGGVRVESVEELVDKLRNEAKVIP